MPHAHTFLLLASVCIIVGGLLRIHGAYTGLRGRAATILLVAVWPLAAVGGHPWWGALFFLAAYGWPKYRQANATYQRIRAEHAIRSSLRPAAAQQPAPTPRERANRA